jgi:hypothetical protein
MFACPRNFLLGKLRFSLSTFSSNRSSCEALFFWCFFWCCGALLWYYEALFFWCSFQNYWTFWVLTRILTIINSYNLKKKINLNLNLNFNITLIYVISKLTKSLFLLNFCLIIDFEICIFSLAGSSNIWQTEMAYAICVGERLLASGQTLPRIRSIYIRNLKKCNIT